MKGEGTSNDKKNYYESNNNKPISENVKFLKENIGNIRYFNFGLQRDVTNK